MRHVFRDMAGLTSPNRMFTAGTVVLAVFFGHSGVANAHLVSTELGPFYDGAAHPLVSPQDLLTILGLAILAAFGGAPSGRRLVVSLTLSWAMGLGIGFALVDSQVDMRFVSPAVVFLLGLAGVFKWQIPWGFLVGATSLLGLARGVMNGTAARNADGLWLSVIGITLGVFVLVTLLTGGSTWLARRPAAVVLRVAGSWIAAIGLLMLGWEFRA